MTSMALAMGRRQGRSMQLGAAAGMAVGLLVLLVFAVVSGRHASSRPSAEAVTAQQLAVDDWEGAIHAFITDGGTVVALGPRSGVGDLAQHRVSDSKMRTMAAGWVSHLSQLRDDMANVTTPPALTGAHDLLDSAMAGYVTASRDLLAAASASGTERTRLLSAAAADGNAADRTYDKATAAIARVRAQLGLPPDWSDS